MFILHASTIELLTQDSMQPASPTLKRVKSESGFTMMENRAAIEGLQKQKLQAEIQLLEKESVKAKNHADYLASLTLRNEKEMIMTAKKAEIDEQRADAELKILLLDLLFKRENYEAALRVRKLEDARAELEAQWKLEHCRELLEADLEHKKITISGLKAQDNLCVAQVDGTRFDIAAKQSATALQDIQRQLMETDLALKQLDLTRMQPYSGHKHMPQYL